MTGFSLGQAPVVLALALAAVLSTAPPWPEAFSNIPPTLSGDDRKQVRIKHPKSAKALKCASKCVATCIRGGECPLNVRSLAECTDICNLIKDGEDGP